METRGATLFKLLAFCAMMLVLSVCSAAELRDLKVLYEMVGPRLDMRHNGFRLLNQIARMPVPLQPLLHKMRPVHAIPEDRLPVYPTRSHVIPPPLRHMDSQRSSQTILV